MAEKNALSPHAEQTRRILMQTHAVLENDHFVYISGHHGSGWIDKDAIFPHTEQLAALCRDLAEEVKGWGIETVCGPATGGLIIAEWTAHALGVLALFTEHDPVPQGQALRGRFVLRRGYDQLVQGKRVLVVDDIVNTGLSLTETAAAVRSAGGHVVGGACLVSRGNIDAAGMGLDWFVSLLDYKIPAWPADRCKLCQRGVPINTRFAHGSEFVARQKTKDD